MTLEVGAFSPTFLIWSSTNWRAMDPPEPPHYGHSLSKITPLVNVWRLLVVYTSEFRFEAMVLQFGYSQDVFLKGLCFGSLFPVLRGHI